MAGKEYLSKISMKDNSTVKTIYISDEEAKTELSNARGAYSDLDTRLDNIESKTVPSYSSSQNGKALTVSDGELAWDDITGANVSYAKNPNLTDGTTLGTMTSGNTTYDIKHMKNMSSAAASGLYKIAVDTDGHVTSATDVTKNDILALDLYQAGNQLELTNNVFNITKYCKNLSPAGSTYEERNWNDATENGWYMGVNMQNSPSASTDDKWYMGRVIAHNANYIIQEVWQFTASTDPLQIPHYMRIRTGASDPTWSEWKNITVGKQVPTNAQFTDTTYSVGTGLTLETGNVIKHTDSVDAKDTLGMYKIKFNASGHITGSSAVSASDIKSLVSYTGGRFINVDSNNTINFAEDCIDISHTTGITSWNDVDKLGWYRATGLNDAPPSTSSTQWWMGHVIAHDGGSQGIYLVQDLWNFSIGGDSTYDVDKFPHYVRVRRLLNGVQTWTPWTKVVTSGIPLDGTGDDTKENNVKGRITFGYTETNGSTTTVTPGTGLNIYVKSDSANFNSFVKWSHGTTWGDEGSTTVYPALIGYHNGWTSSSSTAEDGFICIKPYPTTLAPWSGSVGLVVKKDHVYIDNVELSKVGHSHSNLNLDTAVGSATRPVYFKSDGKPYVCTYKLEKDVPSDAVFAYTAGRCIGINNETISFADLAENITGGDWNNATKTGWYRGSSVTNQPPTISGQVEWFMGYVIAHSADYIIQDLWNFSVDSNYPDMRKIPHYRRCKRMLGNVPTWSDWTAVVEDPIPRAGTGTDDENHNVTGQLTFGYNNNGTITSTSALRMYTKAQSNYVAVARFSYGTNTGSNNWGEDSSDNPEYPAQIGYYNNYGTASDASTRGRIVLLPYHTSSNPWGGTVGLSIEKGSVKIDNVELSKVGHSHAFSEITSKPTTISGYGITDAKIDNGTITLGSKTITPLTSHQSVTDYDVTLSWNTRTSIAKIGTTDIHIKLPAEPSSSYTAGRGIGISSGTISLANYVKIFTTTEYSNGWNDITETGWWASSTTTNSPSTTFTNWWMGHVVSYDGGSQGAYVVQDLWNFAVDSTVTDMTGVPHYQRIRRYNNGAQVWTNWTQVKITDTTYSAGTGLTLGTGNVINHTDAVTAQDTLGMYKIKFNGSGHIKGSDPVTASDISSLGVATTDENVTQTETTSNYYKPILLSNYTTTSATSSLSGQGSSPGTTQFCHNLRVNPNSGNIYIAGKKVAVEGVTNYAGSSEPGGTATKATQDESGNNIKSSYAASISISDHTITLKNKNGVSLGSVTVPDNNTTYSAGTGLSLSSSTFNHSNIVTARNSYTFCKIKYDSCGHIYDYTSVSASDIPDLSSYYSPTGHSHSTSVVNAGSAGSNYYCAVYCSEASGSGSSYALYNYKGIRFRPRSGITDLLIGTNKQGSTNGITGSLYIFRGTYTGSIQVLPPSNGPASDYGVYWPSSGGTLAITSSKSYDSTESMTKRGISGIKGSSPVLITDDNDKDHIIQNMTIRETATTLKIVFKDEQDKKPLYSIAEIPYLKDSDYDSAATIHLKEYDSKSGTYQVISTMIVVSIEHNKEGTLTMTVSPVDETVQLPYIDSVYECD